MSATQEARRLAQDLQSEGWRVEVRGSNHWMAYHPSGVGQVSFGCSPSDWRWLKNTMAKIKRIERAAKERGWKR